MKRADRSRLPATGPVPPFRFSEIQKRRLGTGLNLWVAEQHVLPLTTFVLLLPAGSAADPDGCDGLAAITGDMLDEGSGTRSAIDINEAFGRIGAHFETDVGADSTVLSVTTLARFKRTALSLLADCVALPRMDARDFDRVRQLRLTRLLQLRDVPSAIADRAFLQLLYGSHPYGHPAVGTETALRRLSIEDVVAFHRLAYVPTAATLIVAGEVTAAELEELAADAFGGWTATSDAAPGFGDVALVEPPAVPISRLALVGKPGAPQTELRIGHVALSRDTPDYHALIVVNMVLGGQFVSRMNMKLRQEKGYTYGARTVFDFRRGRGPFLLNASVQNDAAGDAIREAVGEMEAIRRDRPPTPEEVEVARAALTRGYARNFETVEQIARAMAQLVLYRLPDDYFDMFASKVCEVDVERARAAAATHIRPEKLAIAIVADEETVRPQLPGSGFGEPTMLPVTF
jgi:predicted Zn-dependent peptidase